MPPVELDPDRVADARERALEYAAEADALRAEAAQKVAKAQQLGRTWGFDLCPAGHGAQCCGAYALCEAAGDAPDELFRE